MSTLTGGLLQDEAKAGAPGGWRSFALRLLLAALALDLFAAIATGCNGASRVEVFQREAGVPADTEYGRTVEPIFRQECYKCHNPSTHRGGLSMTTYAELMRGGKDGAVVVPGHADRSLLLTLIKHAGPADRPMPMPPKKKLSDQDIQSIEQWIQDGAAK